MAAAAHRSTVRRFPSKEIEPERSVGLLPGHPALSEGRTIFPSTVVASKDSPRFLVSGHNNPKLGKSVLKGPRAGWPIYQLSLEERATCPRSCAVWSECYGNAMPYARRHTPDADFLRYLIAEVTTACRAHPEGLLIRLHTLGDFYSVEYVYVWASLLSQFPQLHVFGYTARVVGDDHRESDRIARAIEVLTEGAWERFSIRTSGVSGARSRSIVVDKNPERANVIVCPAQTSDTEACATCGLCWASAARDKTIAFLKHGMKGKAVAPPEPKAANDETITTLLPVKRIEKSAGPQMTDRILALLTGPEVSLTAKEIMAATGAPYTEVSRTCAMLDHTGKVSWAYESRPGARTVKRLRRPGIVPEGDGLSENQGKLLDAMKATAAAQCAVDGEFTASLSGLVEKSGVPRGSVVAVIDALTAKGRVKMLESGRGRRLSRFRLASPPLAKPVEDYKPAPALPVPAPVVPIRTKITRPAAAPSADDLAPPSKVSAPRTLNARKPGECAYPTNSPPAGRGEDTEYCCAPVSGKLQYCEAHARKMWTPKPKKGNAP